MTKEEKVTDRDGFVYFLGCVILVFSVHVAASLVFSIAKRSVDECGHTWGIEPYVNASWFCSGHGHKHGDCK